MDMHARAFSLILVLGALVGCDDSSRSALTPLSPSLLATGEIIATTMTTGEAIATRTAEMQTKVDNLHASGDIDNAGIARGLGKLLSNAGDAARRDDLKATENMMRAFQNRVRAQRGKHIRQSAADELDADAQEVIDLSTGEAAPTEADLSVALTATPDPVAVGEELTHTITVANAGPADATDLQVSLMVVGDVQPVSAPADCTGTTAIDGLSYDCALAALDAGTDVTLTIVVGPQASGEEIGSQADLTDWAGADDPDATDNIATATARVVSPPTVQIQLPLDGSLFLQGEEITFDGSATDPEEGPLAGTGLVWSSSLDGGIGSGESFTRSDLSVGTHTITLTATDTDGMSGSASVAIEVAAPRASQGASLQWTRVLGPVTDVAISLNDAWGTSATDVWAVGIGSGSRTAILRYDGTDWTAQPTGTTAGFTGVWGSSSDDVFFVGAAGKVRHFDGTGWSFHETPTTATLMDVWGSSGTDVWAVGESTLLHYDGSTWTEELTGYRLWSVWGSSTDVWAVGPGAVLRYDGTSWQPQSHRFPSGQTLTSGGAPMAVWGVGSDVFVVGEYGKLLHYDGSTETWTQHDKPAELNNEGFHAVWGTSATDVYAVGSFGTVLHYDGASWRRTMAGGPTLLGIWGAGGERFVVGGAATILHSTGSGWNVQSTGVEIRSVWGASASDVFAVGRAGLILRYDGSRWIAQNTGLSSSALTYADFHGVSGVPGGDTWVVGRSGAVLRFDGVGWVEERAYGSGSNLHAVWVNASDDIFAVGGANTLLHYDGTSWSDHASPVTSNFQDVFGASGDAVWAVGSSGAIVHYDGTSWSVQSSGTTAILYGAWAAAPNRAFATGNVLHVLRWDGTAWTPQPITGAYSGRAVWGASLNDIFAAPGGTGAFGDILHYDGSTWTAHETGVGIMFHDIWGSSATDIYAVGWGGTIVRGTP